VALLGPRQVGKTTLALNVVRDIPHVYLDLESERDRGKLAQAEWYLESHLDKLVILDEVHRAPGLFPILRGLIDQLAGEAEMRSSLHARGFVPMRAWAQRLVDVGVTDPAEVNRVFGELPT